MLKALFKKIVGFKEHCDNKTVSDDNESGFVLVAVIWITGLLAVVTSAFVVNVTSQIFLSRNTVEGTRLDGAASGLAILQAYNLGQANNSVPFAKGWQACTWNNEITILFHIQDQGGLLDINTATPDLLEALLEGLTRNPQLSSRILGDIQDFKDPDHFSVWGGDEPAIYENNTHGPKNSPFESPFELDQIPSISDELYARLQEFVTVQSQQAGLDFGKAPENLLGTIKSGLKHGADMQIHNQPSASRIYAIDAVAQRNRGGRFHRKVMVNLLWQPEKPFAILEWQRASGEDYAKIVPTGSPVPCFTE